MDKFLVLMTLVPLEIYMGIQLSNHGGLNPALVQLIIQAEVQAIVMEIPAQLLLETQVQPLQVIQVLVPIYRHI
jgi:hypothetical protein